MSNAILVDFGASRIKSVLINTDTNTVIDSCSEVSPSSQHQIIDSIFEVPAIHYWNVFESAISSLIAKHGVPSAIYICAEMHGFVLTKDSEPLTGYISWKDQRVKIQQVEQYAEQFFNTTGMKLRPGLPFTTSQWSTDLIKLFNQDTQFNEITTDVTECLGSVVISRHSIPVYAGIGDLQSAMYGAGLGTDVNAVLNLGTGSQVACKYRAGTEVRPDITGDLISVITHIPCGRALNVLAKFVNSISVTDVFWEKWNSLSVDDVIAATPSSNINFFEAAWKWNGNSGTISLTEERCTFDLVLPEIARTWIQQYVDAINELDPDSVCKRVGVIGGLAAKSPFVIQALNNIDTTRVYSYTISVTGEETLDGLLKISKL